MKLSIAAAIVTMSTTVNARLHPDDDSKKNRELQWGPSKNMVERSLVSPAITAIQGDIDRLEAEDVTLNDQIATANTAIATAETEITELRSDVVLLEAANVTLRDQIATANTAIATANTEITELQDDVVLLEAEDVTLNNQIATANTAIDTANTEITELQDDVISLEAANVTVNARLEAAEATISAAVATIRALTARVQVLEVKNERIVFITSQVYTGSLGGILGAHSKCQTLAIDAELSGTFKAWLSSGTFSPDQDFDKSGGPFVTTTGNIVANDWQDLITDNGSGYLDNAIAFDEKGDSTSGFVWTGTSATGMPESVGQDFCDDWTSNSNSGDARVGVRAETNQGWTSFTLASCDFSFHLYCFEQ